MPAAFDNTLSRVDYLARSIRAVTSADDNPFSRAMAALARVAEAVPTPIAIVGGLAGIHYGSGVTTLDIDIVVETSRAAEIVEQAVRNGFRVHRSSPDGWATLLFPDTAGELTIEVLPAGGKTPRDPADAPPIPTPQQLGVKSGLDFASFGAWVSMKLVANRDKDRYHITEALKHADESRIAAAIVELRKLPRRYLTEFVRLVRNAEDERLP
jgi:hypothetical protein